ncbi:hypothetical protein RQP46_009003 [Phenoliferia psychrophenolica]
MSTLGTVPPLLGGFSQVGTGLVEHAQHWRAWSVTILAVLFLAYLTNPTPTSFRTHLTSLSFHTHLRRLSSSSRALPRSPSPSLKAATKASSAPHVLAFSNRISLAVRTPVYELQDHHLFSTALVRTKGDSEGGTRSAVVEDRKLEKDLIEKHLRTLSAQEAAAATPSEPILAAAASAALSPPRSSVAAPRPSTLPRAATVPQVSASTPKRSNFRPSASSTTRPTSLAKLRSAASSPPPPTSPPPSLPVSPILSPTSHPLSPTHSSQSSYPPAPPRSSTPPPTDPILSELLLQLAELKQSTSQSESRLQSSLETLRARKKDDDTSRAELKGRTKSLEETKRAAELARSEAEREESERRAVVREMEANVARVQGEIAELERRERDVVEKRRKKARERKERERRLRDDVQRKKDDLRLAEEQADKLAAKVRGMEKTLEARREVLFERRAEMSARPAALMGYNAGRAFYSGSIGGSRPASIRSFDPVPHSASTAFSPPSSPPITPAQDDHSPFSDHSPVTTAPGLYGGAFPSSSTSSSSSTAPPTLVAPSITAPLHSTSAAGFLEHRLAHRKPSHSSLNTASNLLPSTSDIPSHFLPFDFDSPSHNASPARSRTTSHDDLPSFLSHHAKGRPQLSLPLQYLDSGFLVATDGSPSSPVGAEAEGPLSPMTPHQASLIPSQLFNMLDGDDLDDDEGGPPDSPTFNSARGSHEWLGLGLVDVAPAAWSSSLPSHSHSHSHSSSASPLAKSPTTATHSPDTTEDDLPRHGHGLSLNPDAKSFAFSLLSPSPVTAAARIVAQQNLGVSSRFEDEEGGGVRRSRMEFSSSRVVSGASSSGEKEADGDKGKK